MAIGTRPADSVRKTLVVDAEAVEIHMAGPTKPDLRGLHQSRVGAPVYLMAVGAVFRNRRMLEDYRTSVLGMAGEAKLVCRVRLNEFVRKGSVRVVATVATHLAFTQGVMRKAHLLANLLFVACIARVHNRGACKQVARCVLWTLSMNHVAIGAAHVPDFMRAVLPEKALLLLMALQAGIVAGGNRGGTALLEPNHVSEFLAVGISVIFSRPVTGFAHQLLGGISRMLDEESPHGRLFQPFDNLFMTALTDGDACALFLWRAFGRSTYVWDKKETNQRNKQDNSGYKDSAHAAPHWIE